MKTGFNKILSSFLLVMFMFFSNIIFVNAAGSASVVINGNNSVYNGDTITLTFQIKNINGVGGGSINGIGGTITYDTSKLEYVSSTSLCSAYSISYSTTNNKFAGFGVGTGISSNMNLLSVTFRAKANGSATVSVGGFDIADANAETVSTSGSSKTITITDPPSSNANLSSLSVNVGSINFNKNTTNYNLNVESNVTSVTINASAEDTGASVSGTGTRNLSYGNNSIYVTVTAPSGAKKTYTISINRKDDRSTDNSLASLNVGSGTLSPEFDINTTTYSLLVPYEVENLEVNAKAKDSKAKVSVVGNTGLISEETKPVTITVTAENGSTKIYTINVTRGKNPDKPKNTDNTLSSITVSSGVLSPSFDKEKTNYIVYIPFEVSEVLVNVTLSDTKYAILKTDVPEKLVIGNNIYTYTVTAEDGSERVYTVTVFRGASMDATLSDNAYLKSIKIKGAKLVKEFSKKEFVYEYKGKITNIEGVTEDESAVMQVIKTEDIYTVLVEAPNGERLSYVFKPNESNMLLIIISAVSVVLVGGGTTLGFLLGKKKMKSTI